MELLDRLGYASSKAEDGGREPRSRAAGRACRARRRWTSRSHTGDEPRRIVGARDRRHAGDRTGNRASARPRRRVACGARLHAQRRRCRRGRRTDSRGGRRARARARRGVEGDRVAELASHGPYRVVVHNAATGVARPALETTDHHWDSTLNANAARCLALARYGAVDAGRLRDHRHLEPRFEPGPRELRARRHLEGRARGGRALSRSRARARDPGQRGLRRSRRHRRTRALPESRGDAPLGRAHAGRPACAKPTTSRARSRFSVQTTPRWCAGRQSSSTAAFASGLMEPTTTTGRVRRRAHAQAGLLARAAQDREGDARRPLGETSPPSAMRGRAKRAPSSPSRGAVVTAVDPPSSCSTRHASAGPRSCGSRRTQALPGEVAARPLRPRLLAGRRDRARDRSRRVGARHRRGPTQRRAARVRRPSRRALRRCVPAVAVRLLRGRLLAARQDRDCARACRLPC